MPLSLAQVGSPALELRQLICTTYTQLQSLAGPAALVMVGLGLVVAMAAGGNVRTVSLVVVVLVALAILSFNDVLGALGAGGGCSS